MIPSASLRRSFFTSLVTSSLLDDAFQPQRAVSGCNSFGISRPPPQQPKAIQSSHDGHLHAVDRRERVEQAFPLLAAVATDPELAGGRPKIEGGRREPGNSLNAARSRSITRIPTTFWRKWNATRTTPPPPSQRPAAPINWPGVTARRLPTNAGWKTRKRIWTRSTQPRQHCRPIAPKISRRCCQ